MRSKKKQPKLDFNSKDCLDLRQTGIVVLCNRGFEEKKIRFVRIVSWCFMASMICLNSAFGVFVLPQEFQADPMSFMGGSGSGVTMAFVNLDIKWVRSSARWNSRTWRVLDHQAEEHGKHGTTTLSRSWTSLLENGGQGLRKQQTTKLLVKFGKRGRLRSIWRSELQEKVQCPLHSMPFYAIRHDTCMSIWPSLTQESRCKSMTPTLEVSSSCAPISFITPQWNRCQRLYLWTQPGTRSLWTISKSGSLSLRSHTWTIMFFSCNVTAACWNMYVTSNSQIDRTVGNL